MPKRRIRHIEGNSVTKGHFNLSHISSAIVCSSGETRRLEGIALVLRLAKESREVQRLVQRVAQPLTRQRQDPGILNLAPGLLQGMNGAWNFNTLPPKECHPQGDRQGPKCYFFPPADLWGNCQVPTYLKQHSENTGRGCIGQKKGI